MVFKAMSNKLALLAFIFISFGQPVEAKNYYRYTDQNGKLILKDYLPPYAVTRGYEVLNEQGRVIQVVAAELTAEQKELEKIRAKQIAKQEAQNRKARQRDALLLRQYNTLEDIERTEKSQTGTMNINMRIVKNHNRSLQQKLVDHEQRAANYERRGKKIPKNILSNINEINEQIENNNQAIESYKLKITEIKQQFNQDRSRYQQLKAEQFIQRSMKDPNSRDQERIFSCEDHLACERAWSMAQIFAHENSTKRLSVVTNTLIITEKPSVVNEVGLSITKIPGAEQTMTIVLEVNCHDSEKGRKLCAGPEVAVIQQKFNDYLSRNQ